MASTLPPVKGAAFTFHVALVSQADTDVFKTSPTLAAGDITVSKDGGNFANITSLPTQIQSTGVLPVALTADEMTADIVTVLFHDAAGDEWQDAVVTIHTAGQTFDTLEGYVDGIADDVLDEVVEGSTTMRQLLRGFAAVLLGKSANSGADYRDLADSKTRVDSTLDGSGNRTAVTLDLT